MTALGVLTPSALPVEVTRRGQMRLAVPEAPRRRYATGEQEPCVRCAERGRAKLGVTREGPDSPPLCWSCWRSVRQERARRERGDLAAAVWEAAGEVAATPGCAACGAPTPVPDCWLCAYSWLQQLREDFAADQAAAADAEFAAIAANSEAEDRVQELTGWVERLRRVLVEYPRGGRWGRPVELLAEALAREAAARSSGRGRPSAAPRVAGVMAVDADVRSGRRSMAGRARTAELAGCVERAVSSAWRRWEALGWAENVEKGRRLTLEERMATGRANNRAVWDLTPAHHGDPAVRAPFVPTALAVLGELLDHGLALLQAAQNDLDVLRAGAGGRIDWAERVRQARLRQAVADVHSRITSPDAAQALTATICTPHVVWRGEYVSSCSLWGLVYSRRIMIHSTVCSARPTSGRWESGASRSPTEGCWTSQPVRRPRTVYPRGHATRRFRPAWTDWAPKLAEELQKLWPWLKSERRARVAATLGSRLGPDWTAAHLVAWVLDRRGGRPVLDAPASPLGYLAALLDEAFASATPPPYLTRRYTEHRHQLVLAAAAADRAGRERRRAELDARDVAAAAERNAGGAGRAAARAIARTAAARTRVVQQSPAAQVGCDWPDVALPGGGVVPIRDSVE